MGLNELPYKVINFLGSLGNDLYLQGIKELSPNLFEFLKIMNSTIFKEGIKKTGSVFINNPLLKVSYTKRQTKLKEIRFRSICDEKRKRALVKIYTDSIDLLGLTRSHIANYLQSYEAAINIAVLEHFYKQRKSIIPIEDSWEINVKDSDCLKRIYFEEYIDLILKSNYSLENYFLLNGITKEDIKSSPKLCNFFYEIESKKKLLLKQIQDGTLQMSTNILTKN